MDASQQLVAAEETLNVTEVNVCDTEVELNVSGIQTNCKSESTPKQTNLEIKFIELTKKSDDLHNENILLRKDLKRKEKIIKVLVQKLRSNLDSTRTTIDAIEKQLLNDSTFVSNCDDIDSEALLPQDFLDFEMNQELISEASLHSDDSINLADDDEDWSPGGFTKCTKEGKYRCKWLGCGRMFSRNANLTRHYNTHLRNRTHQCLWTGCGRRFNDISSLKRHRRNHTGDKPFKCNWVGCDAQFGQASILAYHRKSHTGERSRLVRQTTGALNNQSIQSFNGPFVCEMIGCEKTFDNITNLKRHQAIHNGTRLYYCDWQGCDKNFLELSGLKRHRRIHTGERPYRCDWPGCGARYSQSSHLSTHIKSHKNERDYKCSLPDCSFAGVRMSDLRKHLRRKHKWQQSDFDEFQMEDHIDSSFSQNLIEADLQSI